MRQLKRITLQVVAGANVASIIIMLLVGYSDRLHPEHFPLLSNIGLLFPVLLAINLAFLVFWTIIKSRGVLIALGGFLLCYVPVRKYSPLNLPSDPPKGAIKVLSYNVWLFGGGDKAKCDTILAYIKRQDADIVSLQEAMPNGVSQEHVDSLMAPIYQFRDTIMNGGDVVALYSKFPIHGKERIRYTSKGNVSAAFRLLIQGRTVLVVNNHLETTGLSPEEKSDFKLMVKGEMSSDTIRVFSKWLVKRLGESTKRRAPEAEAVARYIAYHRDMPVIVCGDFNDSPISYAHRTIGDGLTDCYVATGNGPGISYHVSGFFVRIDNIFCSDDFKPYNCHVDRSIKASDHYPIYCWLKMRDKH